MLVIAESWEVTFQDYLILEHNFSEPCLHLSEVRVFSQNRPQG